MKNLILLITIVLVASAETRFYKPSFNCSNVKKNSIEWLICIDESSSSLDRQLSDFYSTYKLSEDKEIKEEQKTWIKLVRNQFEANDCLNRAYKRRFKELANQYIAKVNINEEKLSNSEAKNICAELTTLAENKQLHKYELPAIELRYVSEDRKKELFPFSKEQRTDLKSKTDNANAYPDDIYSLKLNKKNTTKSFFRFSSLGTCSSNLITNSDYLFDETSGREITSRDYEDIRWVYQGADEYPIIYKNRNYIITTKHGKDDLAMVSLVKPSGTIRSLCLLQGEKLSKPKIISSKNDKLCNEYVTGTLKNPVSKMSKEDIQQKLTEAKAKGFGVEDYKSYAIKQYEIDIDLDGKPNNLILFHYNYASSAGCGSDSNDFWIKDLTTKYDTLTDNIINKMVFDLGRYPKDIYVYENEYFIKVAETSGFDITESLVKIKDGKIENVCEFGEAREFEITKYFRID